ncbi:predicted protein [Sclerotinia sclerotiorum 1980 UF-70]|uniref:Uncharacterized protein n=1 Tax=Sclerotinia sclerotiorum (strain ATCC 18683 / 1980 / Ss-1) TaxID=665079 RepID=A7F6U3_SCLS1|nr:predicted protein [Sclerotinia sclerotiorum 1980 UF-70]EDN98464.1 predicted protein [Sclerotinia sclerotiorum 1980 UF-70]
MTFSRALLVLVQMPFTRGQYFRRTVSIGSWSHSYITLSLKHPINIGVTSK